MIDFIFDLLKGLFVAAIGFTIGYLNLPVLLLKWLAKTVRLNKIVEKTTKRLVKCRG